MTNAGTGRVHLLVRNPGHIDTRVRKTSASLQEAGYDVMVFAESRPDVPDHEVLDGIRFERVPVVGSSRDHHRTAYRRRQGARRRRYRTSMIAAVARKDIARTLYVARKTRVVGRPANLRALGATRLRVGLTTLAGRVSLIIGRRLLSNRLLVMRAIRRLMTIRFEVTHGIAQRRWARRERRYRWLAEFWYYEAHARAVIATVGDRPADIIHANDLNTLWAGWRLARRLDARLVYDSHELELDRNTTWTPAKRRFAKIVESFCIRRCDAVITVSDPIADVLQERYELKSRPTLVLNSPPIATRETHVADDLTLRGRIGVTPTERVLVYIGKVAPGRGVETLVDALAVLPANMHLALLGPREERYDAPLHEQAVELGVADRVHYIDSVPSRLVPAVLRGADATLIAIQNVCLSYDLALPNKLFDSVMAGVPTVVGTLTAMSEFVEDSGTGLSCDELDSVDIARTVEKVIAAPPPGLSEPRLSEVQRSIAWERQTERLLNLYAELMASPAPSDR